MIFMGIDPSMRPNGLATCIIKDGKCYFQKYLNLAIFAKDVLSWQKEIFITVEDSSLQSVTFAKYSGIAGRDKINRNIGMNMAASRFIIDHLSLCGYNVHGISPEKKGGKWSIEYAETVAKSQRLEFVTSKKLTQDEIDAFQIALHCQAYYAAKSNY